MSYNNRYKIMDVKFNKQLKNDEIVLQRIVKVNPNHRLKQPTTRDLLLEFMKETREQFRKVNSCLNKQDEFNKIILTRIDVMDTKITDTANLLNKVIKVNNLKTV